MRRMLLIALAAVTLSCLGATAADAQMRFRWVPLGDPRGCGQDCPHVIEAVGQITPDTPRVFLEFIQAGVNQPGARRFIFLHSPGGTLIPAMRLGLMFRELQMTAYVGRFADARTLAELGVVSDVDAQRMARTGRSDRPINGTCASACVYAFLGATTRVVPERSRIGVHRSFVAGTSYDVSPSRDPLALIPWDRQNAADLQRRYIEIMGADPRLVSVEETTSSNAMRFLTPQELARLRIVTREQRASRRR